jgi:hypothetical protein
MSFYDCSLETNIGNRGAHHHHHRVSSEPSPSFPVSPPLSIGSASSTAMRSGPADDPYQFSDEIDSGMMSCGAPLKMREMRSDDSGRRDSNCNGLADYPSSMDLSPSPIAKPVQTTTLMHE